MEILALLGAAGDGAMIVAAVFLTMHNTRLRRIERHLWPDMFKNDD